MKIRGFRIELGEIEAALAAQPGCGEAVVVVREDSRRPAAGGLRGGRRGRIAELRAVAAASGCRTTWCRPPSWCSTALPLTPNGKVDRGPCRRRSSRAEEETVRAPRTPVEEVLAGIWAEVLGSSGSGRHDNFFDLGGHSLLATQVVSRLRQASASSCRCADLFEAPTLAELAAAHGGGAADRRGCRRAPPLVPVPREGDAAAVVRPAAALVPRPARAGQPAYNIAAALRADGPLDAAALARSLGEIVRRHEALRTIFAATEASRCR